MQKRAAREREARKYLHSALYRRFCGHICEEIKSLEIENDFSPRSGWAGKFELALSWRAAIASTFNVLLVRALKFP